MIRAVKVDALPFAADWVLAFRGVPSLTWRRLVGKAALIDEDWP